MPYALGGCFIRMEISVRFPLSAFVPSIPIYIYITICMCGCVCVCVWVCVCVGSTPVLRDLRTTLFSVFPTLHATANHPVRRAWMRWPAGRSGTTSICGAAALGRALGFGTSSMSGTSANRARHWRAYRWARVRLSPFFWPEKDQECYRWTVDRLLSWGVDAFPGAVRVSSGCACLAGCAISCTPLCRAVPAQGEGLNWEWYMHGAAPEPGLAHSLALSRRFFTFAAFTAYGEARCAMDWTVWGQRSSPSVAPRAFLCRSRRRCFRAAFSAFSRSLFRCARSCLAAAFSFLLSFFSSLAFSL